MIFKLMSNYICFQKNQKMLGLRLPTDPRWVNIAEKNIGEILVDHAFCEQKAASSCISLIIQYPDKQKLREVLMPVVSEEWAHFRMVIKELDKRGLALGEARKDVYVHQLFEQLREPLGFADSTAHVGSRRDGRGGCAHVGSRHCGCGRCAHVGSRLQLGAKQTRATCAQCFHDARPTNKAISGPGVIASTTQAAANCRRIVVSGIKFILLNRV